MSRFGKDPKKRILKEELDMTNEFLDNLQKAMPKKCSAIYMYGNHEKRLEKYIESKAPELDGLLSLAEFLHLEKRGIDYRHYGKWLELDNVVYMHGEKLGVKSGYAAHRQMMRVGKTMAMGHTHRLALVHYTDWRGTYRAVEGGCLCQLDPDYVDGVADWQHGFVDWIDGVPTLHDFL
ncbi:MAG: hypothetical protein DRP45_04880 [Candidatus Zixiibacteriota bacterium]|nr:MAG: hypothetical protein DRP45_04880 [candidate division Zixibacteria bacterium]